MDAQALCTDAKITFFSRDCEGSPSSDLKYKAYLSRMEARA